MLVLFLFNYLTYIFCLGFNKVFLKYPYIYTDLSLNRFTNRWVHAWYSLSNVAHAIYGISHKLTHTVSHSLLLLNNLKQTNIKFTFYHVSACTNTADTRREETGVAKCFKSISFIHILREGNGVADSLAKQSLERTGELVAWL